MRYIMLFVAMIYASDAVAAVDNHISTPIFPPTAEPVAACSNETADALAKAVVSAFAQNAFSRLRTIQINPDTTLEGDNLNPGIMDSILFANPYFRSFNNIANRHGAEYDIAFGSDYAILSIIDRSKIDLYRRNKTLFRKKYYRKYYFICDM